MGNRPAHVVNAEINEIRRLIESEPFITGREIQQRLHIPKRRYHRYLNKMNEQDKEAWQDVIQESLESRALKVKQIYEWAFIKIKEIAESPTTDNRTKIDAMRAMAGIQVSLYHLRKSGPQLGQPRLNYNVDMGQPARIITA